MQGTRVQALVWEDPTCRGATRPETRIRAMDKDKKKRIHNFSVINPVAGQATTHIFAADNREDLQKWMEAFWQHLFDLSKLTFGFSSSIFM
ncbi:hypothetical protein J1605_002084 [Eschrichtius robustus]|uniref:PH domain-containing protein n=1 Tax=Eschrichtius robustus TaxID=9764 RepID=A0AB34HUH9_ESCRO|nr:hypothetical protein J1605_002084 [Eschrichtius robustus]